MAYFPIWFFKKTLEASIKSSLKLNHILNKRIQSHLNQKLSMKNIKDYYLFLVNIWVLMALSSEMDFMSHYKSHPDGIYLIIPLLGFGFSYTIIFILDIIFLIKKRISSVSLIWLALSVLFFLMLVNRGDQYLGYFGILLVNCIIAFISIYQERVSKIETPF